MLFKFLCILGICSGFTRFASCFLLPTVSPAGLCTNATCLHGSCTLTNGVYSCSCNTGWKGSQCQTDVNECDKHPCQNRGKCLNSAGGYSCSCTNGWEGFNCDQDVDECTRNPCSHQTLTCLNTDGSYSCQCSSGWTGCRCETDIDECVMYRFCENGATCLNTPGGFTCSCASGWTGTQCQTDINECTNNPCRHGSCTNTRGSYRCVCSPGWTGSNCHTETITTKSPLPATSGVSNNLNTSTNIPSWLEWGAWECHNVDFGCLQSRWRHCSNSQIRCIGDHYDLASCNQKSCTGAFVNAATTEVPGASATSVPSLLTSTKTSSPPAATHSSVPPTSSPTTAPSPLWPTSPTAALSPVPPTSSPTAAPIYWLEWTGWDCQETLGLCLMKNIRNCSTYNPDDCEDKLGGSFYEVHQCRKEICPANWLEWGEWKCRMGLNGSCNMTRNRECSTGNSHACGPKSSMTVPCEKHVCPDKVELHESGRCIGYNGTSCTDASSCNIITDPHAFICQFKDTAAKSCPKACGCCEDEPHWSEWNDWKCSMFPNNTCRMKRTRKCSTTNTNECKGMSELTAACSDSICSELTGVVTKCKDFDSRITKCVDVAECTEFKPYLDVLCSEPSEATKCPVSCGCCASSLHLTTIPPTTSGSISTLTTALPTHVSTILPNTIGSISTLTTAKSSAQWSEWFYGKCSVSCGNGTTNRLRHCNTGRDVDCAGKPFETVPCTASNCPVDGVWSEWTQWSTCTETCGDGMHSRIRNCDNPAPQHDGLQCSGTHNETTACKYMDCPHWSAFQNITSCSVTCGTGFVQLKRFCSTGNQSDCTGSAYTEMLCNLQKCL
ncbi:neurogenic locus notch homolog protein 2-like isoform X2 [Mercenaria mercenaria]|uniref:neurogenic locus notch homolog protein 2-like isoform X2 n=1 Tax=Mercenaria mercenaria TaxID=6596 RepID=UPI00234E4E20|nr:neurogenic locus notch homolog protein 2-like isoform X2 [Mercenaria mercenaria]